jgi:hypothetical protein
MTLELGTRILRVVCAAGALGFVALVGSVYVPALQASTPLQVHDFVSLAAVAFALLIPVSYAFATGHRRDTAMMIGSVGIVLILGGFFLWLWASLIADGFSLRFLIEDSFPRNLFFLLGMAIMAVNAVVCLRSLRHPVATE